MSSKSHPEIPKKSGKSSGSPSLRGYLVVYNVLSALGWSYVFFGVSAHLLGFTELSRAASTSVSPTATSALMRILGHIPYIKSSVPISAQIQSRIPPSLIPFFERAATTFTAIGSQTAFVQSFAVLEIIHSLAGWVRSPITTTVAQVASRLMLVWGITEQYDSARSNPIYASMVLAWSITEVIRYSFYAANRLQYEPAWLLWLRYNTFFVLYPLGAGSEAALIFSTLPSSTPPFFGSSWTQKTWNGWDYVRAILFLIWWPGLYVMYTHMMQQRKKISAGRTAKHTEPKRVKVT